MNTPFLVNKPPLEFDESITILARYVDEYGNPPKEALNTAALCLMDSLGCALLSLQFPECKKLLGPEIEGTIVPHGSRIPGTSLVLNPTKAAFDIGTMIRWLDYNDTWLAREWGHPSDNLGGLLAIADYLCRKGVKVTVDDLLLAMVKAYEIQGGIALYNSFNSVGLDHVILVKVATAAVTAKLLGGDVFAISNALTHAWIDGGPLRAYRHFPNTGSRKSWAAGDQTSRGLMFALMVAKGEAGYPKALSVKDWGFHDTFFKGNSLKLPEQFNSFVIENILFKISYPAEFHAQTAAECAIKLHPEAINRFNDIKEIVIETQESAMRIIDKKGPLSNPADRDHCIQYIVALGLIFGEITAESYEEKISIDPRIDMLREKIKVVENKQYTIDYLDPNKRSIANAITLIYQDGSSSERIEAIYPIGHKNRRAEAIPLLYDKFQKNMHTTFNADTILNIMEFFKNPQRFSSMLVSELIDLFIKNK